MQGQVGCRRCGGGNGGVGGCATLDAGTATINIPHQLLHLLQGAGQHENVVASQQQGGDFGEFTDRRPLSVGHDFPQAIHGLVQVVHSFSLPAVDLQSQFLHLVLAEFGPGLSLAASRAALRHGMGSLFPVFAVRLEHLVGEETSSIIYHQIWR